jgi:integrase
MKQVAADFLWLVALTGQRRSEVARLAWQDLDWKAREWNQRAETNKTQVAHSIPLGARAVALLNRRRDAAKANGEEPTGLVLPSAKGGLLLVTADALMDTVQAAGGGDFRLHDLRRGMVSAMAELGVDFAVADSLLNHSASASRHGTLAVYQKAELKAPKRRAMDLWEAAIFDEPAQIIPLRKERA